MKPFERLLVGIALLAALFAILQSTPNLPAARADQDTDDINTGSERNIAVCNIWKLTYELANSDRFAEQREEYEQIQENIMPLWERLEEAREKYEQADPDDDDQEELENNYRTLSQEYSKQYERYRESRDPVFTKIIVQSREMVVASARAVAKELDYTYLISNHSAADPENPIDSYSEAWQQHLADPIILFPEAADLTIDVRDDLNLD